MCLHNDTLIVIFISCKLTFNEVGYMQNWTWLLEIKAYWSDKHMKICQNPNKFIKLFLLLKNVPQSLLQIFVKDFMLITFQLRTKVWSY